MYGISSVMAAQAPNATAYFPPCGIRPMRPRIVNPIPALKPDGEIGQQIGYLNAAGVGTVNFIILILIGWAFAHKEQVRSMIGRLRRLSPGYNPPPFSPHQLLELIEQNVDKIPPELGLGILGKPILEVTAAVEPAAAPGVSEGAALRKAGHSGFSARVGADDLSYDNLWEPRHTLPAAPARARFPLFEEQPKATPAPDDSALASIRGEIDELKTLIQGFVRGYPAQERLPAVAAAPAASSRGRAGLLATIMAQLTGRGIEAEAAETIGRHAVEAPGFSTPFSRTPSPICSRCRGRFSPAARGRSGSR